MILVGLTGGYCTGKNSVAALMEERGWTSVDVDRLGHLAVERRKAEIVARFEAEARAFLGRGILDAVGRLDRRALGALVFADPAKLADHEAIVHPAMFALLDESLAELDGKARKAGREARILVNAAILYKMPVALRCDCIIEVHAPLLARLARARRRDKLGIPAALARIRRQAPLWNLRDPAGPPRLILRNSGRPEGLGAKLDRVLARSGRAGFAKSEAQEGR